MKEALDSGAPQEDRNPFASSRTRPGACEYRFPSGETAADLLDRFERQGSRGQIVGPHGSGKSTLLAALLLEAKRRGWQRLHVELHDGQGHLPDEVWAALREPAPAPRLVVVDGYEQLGSWQRWRLARAVRRNAWSLLITSHQDCGMPTLAQTKVDLPLAVELAARLQADVDAADVERSFADHGGNLRDVWFDLYDLYERRRSQQGPPRTPPDEG